VNLNLLNTQELAGAYVAANTASYLFRRFRAESSVLDFARAHSAQELAAHAANIAANVEHANLIAVVSAYAAVVALTFKEPQDVTAALAGKSLDRLEWADLILRLWHDSSPALSVVNATLSPLVKFRPLTSRANTTEARIVLAGGPDADL